MKRHIQQPGIRKWAGNDMIELQSEPLKALDGFFAEYGPCIVQGLETAVTEGGYSVNPGLVVLTGMGHEGTERTMIVPFEGVEETLLPLYLTLAYRVHERVYADEKVRPVTYEYYADFTTVAPVEGVPHIKLLAEGNVRFTDVLQDSDHRFITDAERADWNSKATGDHVHAVVTTSKAGFMSAQDKQKLETANNDIADIKSGFIAVGKAKVADSVAWTNVTGKTDATTSASGLMSGTDKTNLGAAMTDIANLKSGATAAGKVEWANVINKTEATTSASGLMSAADKSALGTATTNITNIFSGASAVGVAKSAQSVTWANVSGKTDATTSASGLMSAADKTSLNNTVSGLSTATTNIANLISGATAAGVATVANSVTWANVSGKTDATTSASGLMSAADKVKLNGLGGDLRIYCIGRISTTGAIQSSAGGYFHVLRAATGKYTITHNLLTTNYFVFANAITDQDRMVVMNLLSTTQCSLNILNGRTGLHDCDFMFTILLP